MSAVPAKLGVPLEEAVAKYGLDGEFFDAEKAMIEYEELGDMVEYEELGVPPRSQPPGYCNFSLLGRGCADRSCHS